MGQAVLTNLNLEKSSWRFSGPLRPRSVPLKHASSVTGRGFFGVMLHIGLWKHMGGDGKRKLIAEDQQSLRAACKVVQGARGHPKASETDGRHEVNTNLVYKTDRKWSYIAQEPQGTFAKSMVHSRQFQDCVRSKATCKGPGRL